MHDILQTIIGLAQTTLGLKPDELDPDVNILELGLDSLMIIRLAQEIERRFEVSLEARWFLTTMPSMSDLARHVLAERPKHAQPFPSRPETAEAEQTTVAIQAPQPSRPETRSKKQGPHPDLAALFETQLRTMQDLFAAQLRAMGATPAASHSVLPSTAAPETEPVRLERNLRGFVFEPTPLDSEQQAFVSSLVARHTARTPGSRKLGRDTDTLADWKSSLSYRPELADTAYPLVADTTYGGRFRDVDGNEYIDIALGMGVHFLGHNPPYVVEALRKRLDRGFGLGPQCDLTAEAARRISRLTGMERVSFCNTGSEAVMFALRLARAKTGRPLVALFNGAYHGTFDGVLAASENGVTGTYSPGTPPGMVKDVLVLDYNAESALEMLRQRGRDVAAVLVEPVQSRKPGLQPQTFLRRLRRITRELGICLIFDEMVNGFRTAPGGAQQHFGVTADMALYGKVAGGGLPVGIVTGSREYLDYIDGGFLGHDSNPAEAKTIVFGGTFCRHPLSMEGVVAATGYLLDQGPGLQDRVSRLADALADRLNLWFQDNCVPLRMMHFGPQFIFESYGPYSSFAQPIELPLFFLLLMEQGVYTWERRTCGLCTEHTEDDIRHIEDAVKHSVHALRAGGFAFELDKGAPRFFHPMSATEERLYAIFQREHGQDAYHLPLAWRILEKDQSLDRELLEISLGQCIRRHEALRSSFHHLGDQLLRKVVDEPAFALERIDPAERSGEEILRDFIRPFDLERAPLMRAGLAAMPDGGYLFVLDLLHIAADGASLGILLDDLNQLMNGQEPQRPGSACEPNLAQKELAEQDAAFWTQRLADLSPLELPLDFPARSGSPLGRQDWMTLDRDVTAGARRAARTFSVTMNMFLNAAYALLLHKISDGTRFCVGMAEGGRHGEGMEGVMGMFVNTVPQDFTVRPEWSLAEFMAATRLACAESMARNRAPYGDIVQRLGWSPAATMLSYEKADERRPTWPGLEFTALVPPGRGAMYDFAIDIVEMDGVLHCNLLSSEALRPETARCFGECFAHLVGEISRLATDDTATVRSVSPLPPSQADKVLRLWQGPEMPFDPAQTVVHLCRAAAGRHADKTALVCNDSVLSYAELDRHSDLLARHLAAAGVGREQVVAIRLDRCLEFVVAALGVMKAGAAYLPLDPEAPDERVLFQLRDACAPVLISTADLRPDSVQFDGCWINAHTLTSLPDTDHPLPEAPGPDNLAYVIYTSGTTGRPKGVMIEHRSLSNLCHWFIRDYAITAADRTTAFAPFIFDASVWELFPMLMQGATVHVFDNDIRRDLPRIHDYLRRERITVTYFLSQVSEMIDGQALPDLRLMLCGGEVMRMARPAGPYRHNNSYGPTECTITAATMDLDGTWPVPIGRLVANTRGLIVDADFNPRPIGVPGELYLAGVQVGRGYLNRPEQTHAAFLPNPLADPGSSYARMYRTGDICRWLPDGNIEFLGRADSQIKIRGHRVEPGEIEKTLLTCPGVRHAAAMVREENGGKLLCLYVVVDQPSADAERLQRYAAEHLPAYMTPDRIMVLEEMPVGGTGKVDKKALPPIPADTGRPFAEPQTPEEGLLSRIWAEQLNVERVGRHDDFFDLGGDSIKALMVTSRIRAAGYALDARELYHDATIAALAPRLIPLKQAVAAGRKNDLPESDRQTIHALFGDVDQVHNLSPLQQGIVFHGGLHPESKAYLEQNLLDIRGPLDVEAMARNLRNLMDRHGMLRSAVLTRGLSRPCIAVLPPGRIAPFFQRVDLSTLDSLRQEARIREIMHQDLEQGFDLTRPPLIRFTLLRAATDRHFLLCTAHHVIVDGWSMGVLFSELFSGPGQDVRPAQFAEYMDWLENQDKAAALSWWQNYLDGVEPTTVPGHRPASGEYQPARQALTLPDGVAGRLRALAGQARLTVNVILQAAWGVVLSRCGLGSDVLFGEVVSGRPPELPGVDGLIGLCANTVPVRVQCTESTSFHDLAVALRDTALSARQHSHCSLAEIQNCAGQDLLTHFFVLENYPPPRGSAELTISVTEEFSQTSFDFAVVWEERDGLHGFLVYNARCFEAWSVEALADAYVTVLEAVARTMDQPLRDIPMVSAAMKTRLDRFRAPVVDYPDATVIKLFRHIVSEHCDRTALIFRGHGLTYGELDHMSDALARRLAMAGAGPERIVAVLLRRGPFFAVALLAALKSGGAFLPLAVDAPTDRLRFQLEDSQAVALVAEADLCPDIAPDLPRFDVDDPALFTSPGDMSLPDPDPAHLAYVIYTSGTTGQPKGVAVEHRSLTNQTLWTARHYGLGPESRLTAFAAHAFDVSIWELFPSLVSGATLHVLGDELRQDLNQLSAYLRANAITDTWMPPHLAVVFLQEHDGAGLKSLTAGGDVFKPRGDYPFLLYNNYGPTECAITATSCPDFAHAAPLSIGRPVDNTDVYILARQGQLQPVGIPGELCITGVQVARGYLNRPDQTRAAFVPNPYADGPLTARMYKTGDLCRWMPDGSIEFLGRLDQQVKIRGHRIEVAEIEQIVREHPLVAQCVVRADHGQLYLYVIPGEGTDLDARSVRAHAAGLLPPYMVPEHVLFLQTLPLTASGKIDKKALPLPEPTRSSFVPPASPEEQSLCRVLAQVLEQDKIGLDDDFFQLGGDSIKALMAASRLWSQGYKLDLQTLYSRTGLANVARAMTPVESRGTDEDWTDPDVSAPERAAIVERTDRDLAAICRVTPMQEAMLAATTVVEGAYVISNWADIKGNVDPAALENRWRLLVQRHDALRTVFDLSADRPRQVVLRQGESLFRFEDVSALDEKARQQRFENAAQPLLNPVAGPLVGIWLFRLGPDRFRMLLAWHHLILDGWSLGQLLGELFSPNLSDQPPVSFLRHVRYLAEHEQDLSWWSTALSDPGSPALMPRTQTTEAGSREPGQLTFSLTRQVDSALRRLSKERGLTLAALLQAVWAMILARHANQDEVVYGCVHAGRPAGLPGVERLMGLCVTTLPVRVTCAAHASFTELTRTIQTWHLDAEPHAFCSLTELKTLAGPGMDQLFVFENQPPLPDTPDLTITPDTSAGFVGADLAVEWTDTSRLTCTIHYNAALFETWRMKALREHWLMLLEEATRTPDVPWTALAMLTPAEERRILVHCNRTDRDFGPPATVVDLFRDRVRTHPDKPALVCADVGLTYTELDHRTDALAASLAALGAGPEQIVGVLLPRNSDFIVAVLGIMKAGAAYLPLDPDWPAERLAYVAHDAGLGLIVDCPPLRHVLGTSPARRVDVTEACGEDASHAGNLPRPESLAYVIYTSGSTGRPKGVQLEHAGLTNLCRWQHDHFPLTANDVCTSYAPWTFDASVYEIFPALTAGATLHVLPESLRLDAEGLRLYLRAHGVSVSFLPPQVGHQVLDGHEFPDLRVVTLAGDKPGALAPRAFTLRNCYGPTEFTVCATSWVVSEHRLAPPIGTPVANAKTLVLDRHGRIQPFGAPGELCLSGIQTARGYLHNPEQTNAAFVPNPFGSGDHARMYRTGDLCRLMPDGNLEFLGRLDSQVKLRGQRLELGEVEAALLSHPAVSQAVAVLREDGNGLCAYAQTCAAVEGTALSAWLSSRLPAWMVPASIVILDTLPLTANGKIDREALPRPDRAAEAYQAPRTTGERILAQAWNTVLGVDRPGRTDNFFLLGGDSIKAMLVVSRLRGQGLELSTKTLFEHPTLEQAAAHVRPAAVARDSARGPIPPARDLEVLKTRFGARMTAVHALTPMQEGLLYHHTLEPDSPAYIEQSRLDLRGPLDEAELSGRVREAVGRHPAMRTVFHWKGVSRPWQVVLDDAPEILSHLDLTQLDQKAQDARLEELLAAVRANGLNPAQGPLLQLTLCPLGPDHHALLVSFHHLILDGWSLGLLATEFFGPSASLPPAPAFGRYVDWLHGRDQSKDLAFWRTFLDGAKGAKLPGLKASPVYDARDIVLNFDRELSDRLTALAATCQVTVNTVLQTAWAMVLGRAVNRDDVLFGIVLSGRGVALPGVEDTVGLFVNTVPMRVQPRPDQSVAGLLTRVQADLLELEPHAHIPLTGIQRQASTDENLISHLFVFENLPPLDTAASLTVTPANGFNQTNYDLCLVFDQGHELSGRMRYNAAALEPWLMETLGDHLLAVLRQMADNPDIVTGQVTLAGPPVFPPRPERLAWPTVVDLFRVSTGTHGSRTAVVCGRNSCTYAELDERSEALAHELRRTGAGPDTVVAVLMSRRTDFVVSLLGVLKAGAAYLVLDPDYPAERLAFLLADANPVALLTDSPDLPVKAPCPVRDVTKALPPAPEKLPAPGPRDLAYLVYTSGTTGQPKGVQIEHHSLANFTLWHVDHYGLTPEDRAGHVFSFAFDASAWGIFPLLSAGGSIHILDHAERTDPEQMHAAFEREAITLANIPTILAEQIQNLPAPGALRLLATGGDALRTFRPQPYLLFNEYGPSESTIMATCHHVQAVDGPIPIGQPIAGTRAVILDQHGNPQPVGLPGELHLSGPGLARGYLNRPEQTAFVLNPFAPADDPDYARFYRTGDLCRELPSGTLEFLGRMDTQLSLRGFRIEPAEIEQKILAVPGVGAAAVTVWTDASGDKRLCAYVVADDLDVDSLKATLRRTLPVAMIPSLFVRMDSLPLTSNGKIDRGALPVPSRPDTGPGRGSRPPVTALELAVARIWEDVLDLEGIGLDDDFFRLGGDSIKAVRLASRLESALGCPMTTAELMGGVTIAGVTQRIRAAENGWRPLITVREGVGTALVLVHAVGGSVLCYKDLVDALPLHRPVFVLPPYGLDSDQKPDTDLGKLAARYVPSLLERFPDGDFLLVGLCMAGMTAWEVARQLLDAGCRVRGVISLNTRSRLLESDSGQPLAPEDIPHEVPEHAVTLGLETMTGYDGHSPQDNALVRAMLRAQLLAWGHYQPLPLPLPMTCIRPSDPVNGAYLPFETRPLGWAGLALAGASEVYCAGNHFSMFKKPHAPGLAQLLEDIAQAGRKRSAPLTPIQRWFFSLDMTHGQFFQSVVLQTDRVRSARSYQDVLQRLAARHDMLRAVFPIVGGEIEQRIMSHGQGFGFRTCRDEELDTVIGQLSGQTHLDHGPLAWAVLVPGDQSRGDRLALLIHHLVVDGVSWRILQQDFITALNRVDMGLPPDQAASTGKSFADWAVRLAAYARRPEVLEEAHFWRTMLAGRPKGLCSEHPVSLRRKADLRQSGIRLDREETRTLLGPCRKSLGRDMNTLLLTALVLAAQAWQGLEGLTVDLEGHGRQDLFPDCPPDDMVGWFTTVHPVVLEVREDLIGTVRQVGATLDKVPDKGICFGLLCHVVGMSEFAGYEADVLFNYLGDASGGESGPVRLERIGFESDVAPDFPQQAKLAVTGLIRDGGLELTVESHREEFSQTEIVEFLRCLRASLAEIIRHGHEAGRG